MKKGKVEGREILFALAGILLFSLATHLWGTGSIPQGAYCDEASIGYDAWSILQTGADHHGSRLPVFFQSFGEYKYPLYIYATIPSVALFGLNEFSTRLPAALFGVLAVLAIFLLGRELFDGRVGLLSALFLSISPWAFQFSRIAFEASALPAILMLGAWLFVKGTRAKEGYALYAGIALFALSLYAYGSARLFAPLFLFALAIIFHAELLKRPRKALLAGAIGLVVALPFIYTLVASPDIVFARYNVVSVFASGHKGFSEFAANLPKYYDYNFLFVQGDRNLRHLPSGTGELPLFLAPLAILGLEAVAYALLTWKKPREHLALLAWFALFAVPAALTWEGTPHSLRAITGIGVFELVGALGAVAFYDIVKRHASRKALALLVLAAFIIIGLSAAAQLDLYFNKYPLQGAAWWESGLPASFGYVSGHQAGYDAVFISPKIDRAYMYALFYLQVPPAQYQKAGLGKIYICDPPNCPRASSALYLVRAGAVPNPDAVFTSLNPDGTRAFEVRRA